MHIYNAISANLLLNKYLSCMYECILLLLGFCLSFLNNYYISTGDYYYLYISQRLIAFEN